MDWAWVEERGMVTVTVKGKGWVMALVKGLARERERETGKVKGRVMVLVMGKGMGRVAEGQGCTSQ
jgi:hypothetical protein